MAARDEVLRYADEYLRVSAYAEFGPSGAQVLGAEEVTSIACGVSSSQELFTRAGATDAQLVIVHHGLFWRTEPLVVDRRLRGRLQALFDADLTLAAYHLPLDAHPEVGNNALICEALGLERSEPFGDQGGRPIGFVGRSEEGVEVGELLGRCERAFGRQPFAWREGPELVRSVGIVSGGGASSLAEAVGLGLDAFLTGEPSEPAMADAAEAGVHFIAGGHYGTETFGVKRLGELTAARFGVEHRFFEIPNPV